MFSKSANHRSTLASEIAGAAKEWSAATSEKLEALLTPYLHDGETLPDLALFQQLLGRLVGDRGSRLASRDEALQKNLLQATHLRRKRDEAAEELRDLLRSARFYFDQTQGRGAGAKMGIGHGLSWMAPFHLWRNALDIARRLEITPPARKAKLGGLPDPRALAAAIVEQSAKLEALLAELRPYTVGSAFARGEQHRGLADTDHAVRRCSGILSELYKLSGYQVLAKKIRPAFRRKPRRKKGEATLSAAAEAMAPLPESSILDDLDLATIRVAENREPLETFSPSSVPRRFRVRRRR